MSKNFRINLDLKRPDCTPLSGFKQGDNLATISGIVLQDSTPYNLTGLTLRANFKLPDGTVKYQNVTLTNAVAGEFSLIVLSSILEQIGIVLADISVFNADRKITSSTFKMIVAESIYSKDAIVGEGGKDLFQQIIETETDRVNSEKTRKTNEIVRIENENIRKANEIVREDNESKRKTGYSKMDTRIDNLVLGQGSAAEVIDARLDGISNIKYPTLKARLDDTSNQLTQNALATLTTTAPITYLDNATDGLMQVDSIKGRTRYKKADGNYTDAWEKGVKLESVGEKELNKIEILSHGKNLCDNILSVGGLKSQNGDLNKNALDWKTCEQYILIDTKKQYSFSSKGGEKIHYFYYDSNKVYISYDQTVFNPPLNTKYVRLSFFNNNVRDVQFEEGTVTTPYEPYKEDKIAIQLQEPLRGAGDVKDEIDVVNGKLIQRTKKEILNSDSSWNEYLGNKSELYYRAYISMPNAKIDGSCICNNFANVKYAWEKESEGIAFHPSLTNLYITILKSKLTTPDLAGFKKWLTDNPIEIIYELATPVITDLKIPTLKSFKDGSVVLNNTIPPSVNLKYPTSISGRLSSVENTVDDTVDRTQKLEEGLFATASQVIDNKEEVIAARNGEVDLKTRIDKIDSQLAGNVDVADFGAKGDGITNDTLPIQNAFNSGKSITFNKGKTYIVQDLQLSSQNITINGNGATLKTKELGKTCININYPAKNIKFNNLNFLGTTDATTESDGSPKKYSTNPNGAGINIIGRDTDLKENSGIVGVEFEKCNFLGNFTFSIIATHMTDLIVSKCFFTGNCYVPTVGAGGYSVLCQACFGVKIYNNKFLGTIFDRHAIYISSISVDGIWGDNRCTDISIHDNLFDWTLSEIYTEMSVTLAIRNPVNCYIYANTIIGGFGAISINPSHGNAENIHIYGNNIQATKNRRAPGENGAISLTFGDKKNNFISKKVFIHDNKIECLNTTSTVSAIAPNNVDGFEVSNNYISIGDLCRGIYLNNAKDGIVSNNILNGNNLARAWLAYGGTINDVDIMPNKIKGFVNYGVKPELHDGTILTNVKHKYKRFLQISSDGSTTSIANDVHGLVSSVVSTYYGCDIIFNKVYDLSVLTVAPLISNVAIIMTRGTDHATNTYSLNLYNSSMVNVPLASVTTSIALFCEEY